MYRGKQREDISPLFAGHEGVAQALTDFLAMVQNLIPKDKFETFKTLFRFPVITNEVLAVCYDKLSRIFDGRNPAFSYQFAATEQRDDWEWYRQEKLGEPAVWSTKGWDFFKTQITAFLSWTYLRSKRQATATHSHISIGYPSVMSSTSRLTLQRGR
jgi:hypothetical protein